jgi:hypothetical protein
VDVVSAGLYIHIYTYVHAVHKSRDREKAHGNSCV